MMLVALWFSHGYGVLDRVPRELERLVDAYHLDDLFGHARPSPRVNSLQQLATTGVAQYAFTRAPFLDRTTIANSRMKVHD